MNNPNNQNNPDNRVNSQAVTEGTNHNTIFMVYTLHADKASDKAAAQAAFATLCARVINLNHSADIRFPDARASIVLGISENAWHLLELPTPLPKELKTFTPIQGSKHTAVATPGDIHLHIRANTHSFCIDAANQLANVLNPVGQCIEEVHGFRYWDGRSILGFVDGTENPSGDDRAHFAIVSAADDPQYAGGSYVFVQKYLHDMQAWQAIGTQEQENVIGRSKQDDIEMPADKKPQSAHSARANIGDDKKVVRDNMPFGNIGTNEMGTYFIAYASTFSTVKAMLESMFIGEDGVYDRILDFSEAKTGTLFFAPSADMLADFAGGDD